MFSMATLKCSQMVRATTSFAAIGLVCLGAHAADINTSALSQNGWFSDDTRADGSGTQAAGTNLRSTTLTAPPESGSGVPAHDADILSQILFGQAPGVIPPATWTGAVNLFIDAVGGGNGKSTISHRKDDGIGHAPTSVLAPGLSMVYSWMGNNLPVNPNIGAALKIGIKTSEWGSIPPSGRTGENSWDKLLVYEPYFNGNAANGTWHTETISFASGNWWIVDRTANVGNSQNNPMPLSAMAGSAVLTGGSSPRTVGALWSVIMAPGSHITNIQFGVGSGNPGANVYVNQLVTNFYRAGDRTTFGPPPNSLSLVPTGSCYKINDTVVVQINVANLPFAAAGGQFFINFDHTKLQFLSAVPGDPGTGVGPPTSPTNPFETEVYECNGQTILGVCTPVNGRLDYAVGVPGGGPGSGSIAKNTMAVLRFKAIGEACNVANLVRFRDNVSGPLVPPTRLTDEFGVAIYPNLMDLPAITIDSTAPVISCPPTANVQCPTAPTPANAGTATAIDACDPTPTITFSDYAVNIFGSPLGWASRNDGTASGTPVVGPAAPPAGAGSFRVQTGPGTGPGLGGKNYLFTTLYDGTPLASLTELKYWTYVSATADPNLAPAINLYVDLDNNGTRDTTLVYEPTYAVPGAIPAGWNQWNALANVNAWWYTANFGTMNLGGGGEYRPLSYYIAQYPSAKIVNWSGAPGTNIVTGQASGGSWANYDGNVDMIEINGADYNFEAIPFCSTTIFRTWKATDDCNNTSQCVQTVNVIDTVAPVFNNACPLPTINVNSDAGTCEASGATVNPAVATANDACTTATVTFVRSDGKPNLSDPYEAVDSPIVITWTATDVCGNFSTCTQTVNVAALNELLLTLQLEPNITPPGLLTRCIRLELWGCPGPAVIVDVPITFNVVAGPPNALATSASVLVPCGNYTCITARDRRHTLRRTANFADGDFFTASNKYVANFTGDPFSGPPGGDWLIGGNLNDDQYIDILDFGTFVSQYGGPGYGTGSTTCATPYPHADISGDGLVTLADFSFIQINFLKFHEANCCGAALRDSGPITRISVKELVRRGMRDLVVADLNGDGWLDTTDAQVFMSGGGGGGGGGGGRR